MKTVILVPNKTKDPEYSVTLKTAAKLTSLGYNVCTDRIYGIDHPNISPYQNPPIDAEFAVVVGGDGSVIDASTLAIDLDIPILGINLGRVGYLTEVDPDNLDILDSLERDCAVEERMLIYAEYTDKSGNVVSSSRHAVNDIVVSHGDYLGIADFTVSNSGGETVKYRADGLVISTPVGSTAYSLSAGGPVISHSLDSITVTPVCPHSFFNRSIVYDPCMVITVCNSGQAILNISVDGRYFAKLERGESCTVRRSDKKLKVLTFDANSMFSTLFKKIKVLEDKA